MNEPIPHVSVVVVNYRRPDDTIVCLEGLQALDWPDDALDVIVVDNGSGDDSAARIRATAAAAGASVIESKENLGFAGGCNLGAARAKGDYVAFLNNDARPDPRWLREAMPLLTGHGSVACVASKVLDWDGNVVDFVDAGAAFYGHGFKLHAGARDQPLSDEERDVLFASGAAMIVDRAVFLELGGFDERYFMFFEDVDFGWRLWLAGYRVRFVPTSVVFHRHHASMEGVGSWREWYLLDRNALFTIYKNYDDHNLTAVLPAALALSVRRGVAMGGDDPHALDLERGGADDETSDATVSKQLLASTYAVDAFVEALPELAEERARVQARRRRSDQEIFRLFRLPLHANVDNPYFHEGFFGTVDALHIRDVFSRRKRILVASGDSLRPAMAGPAIRAWQIAAALSREHDVELVSITACDGLSHPDFHVSFARGVDIKRLVEWCDIVIFQGFVMAEYPVIERSKKIVICDIYDPFHLEQLEQARDLSRRQRRETVQGCIGVLNQQLARGDLFMCASAKQRDFWLGQLSGIGRINPLTYDADETMRDLVRVVPFGVSDSPPTHSRRALKGVVPGIGEHDKVILWGGGIYNWFDPLTLLRAVDKLRGRLPDVRLYFLGLKHPNPHVPEMRMAVTAQELADELGLTNTHAFFNEGWVDYDDRQNYFLESDVGVSTHLDHVETEFSFRTRILDYLWTSLPVVATQGDALADLIERHGAGITVPAQDVDALEEALYTLLSDDARNESCREAAAAVAGDYRWSKVLEPLLEFCRDPHRAADLVEPAMTDLLESTRGVLPRRKQLVYWRNDVRAISRHIRSGDWKLMASKATARVKRTLRA